MAATLAASSPVWIAVRRTAERTGATTVMA
jgi:hypothetical protein